MSGDSQHEIEVELAEHMWMHGYLPVRCPVQVVDSAPEPDMVFIKGGRVVVVKVVHLRAGSSKKKVRDKARELRDIKSRIDTYEIGKDSMAKTGFAVKKGMGREWYWAGNDTTSVLYNEDLPRIEEVLPV